MNLSRKKTLHYFGTIERRFKNKKTEKKIILFCEYTLYNLHSARLTKVGHDLRKRKHS